MNTSTGRERSATALLLARTHRVADRRGRHRRRGGAEHGQRPRGFRPGHGSWRGARREAERDVAVERGERGIDGSGDPGAGDPSDDPAAALVERGVGAHAGESRALALAHGGQRQLGHVADQLGAAQQLATLTVWTTQYLAVLAED